MPFLDIAQGSKEGNAVEISFEVDIKIVCITNYHNKILFHGPISFERRKCNNLAYILTIMGYTKYFSVGEGKNTEGMITLRGISANSCMETSRNYLF